MTTQSRWKFDGFVFNIIAKMHMVKKFVNRRK